MKSTLNQAKSMVDWETELDKRISEKMVVIRIELDNKLRELETKTNERLQKSEKFRILCTRCVDWRWFDHNNTIVLILWFWIIRTCTCFQFMIFLFFSWLVPKRCISYINNLFHPGWQTKRNLWMKSIIKNWVIRGTIVLHFFCWWIHFKNNNE